jgi:predicted enzyme related to lactoylglutathione lyase
MARISFIELPAKDIAAAKGFYSKGLWLVSDRLWADLLVHHDGRR